jgi:hypothetical protein
MVNRKRVSKLNSIKEHQHEPVEGIINPPIAEQVLG